MPTQTTKEKRVNVVSSPPADGLFDEIIRKLAFEKMVDQGLEEVRAAQLFTKEKKSPAKQNPARK